jgi:glutaredoxin
MEDQSIPRPLVEIYSKPGCSLCVATRAAAEAVRLRLPFDLVERDVRQDPALGEQWRYDIPVVCIDGRVEFLQGTTEEALEERLLERARMLSAGSSPAPGRGQAGPG